MNQSGKLKCSYCFCPNSGAAQNKSKASSKQAGLKDKRRPREDRDGRKNSGTLDDAVRQPYCLFRASEMTSVMSMPVV